MHLSGNHDYSRRKGIQETVSDDPATSPAAKPILFCTGFYCDQPIAKRTPAEAGKPEETSKAAIQ
jgi:hypothetical protein